MSARQTIEHSETGIQAAGVTLPGHLAMPPQAQGIVVFAHGSGSSRFSPRNRFVAEQLNEAGLATLLFDLLTADENAVDQRTRELRFDIPLLAERLTSAVDWLTHYHPTEELDFGLCGASTGAAAALITASQRPGLIKAVVCRGGRPDLAADALRQVQAPTLLIVGSEDAPVIEMNRQAAASMRCEQAMEIVPGATHLFEEPGKLDEVARLATAWFEEHLGPGG
jgi:dienelactone hydrolase